MPGFDRPSLGGYTLQNPPIMDVRWEEVSQVNELADGGIRKRSLGYRLRAVMSWEDGWIRRQDLTGLAAVANDASASITFIPRPTTYPTRTFEVIWLNKFNFGFHEGKFGYYGGTIELQSPTVTSTVGELP